jgi:hypothetical protein
MTKEGNMPTAMLLEKGSGTYFQIHWYPKVTLLGWDGVEIQISPVWVAKHMHLG